LLGHHLIKRRHIGRKQRIQTAPEHIIIKVIGAEPGAETGLLAKNCGNMQRS
jgi:hypothetical protein